MANPPSTARTRPISSLWPPGFGSSRAVVHELSRFGHWCLPAPGNLRQSMTAVASLLDGVDLNAMRQDVLGICCRADDVGTGPPPLPCDSASCQPVCGPWIASLRRLMGDPTSRSTCSLAWSAAGMTREPGYTAVQIIHGIGPNLAAVFVAESMTPPGSPAPKLTCWAGLTPEHHESNTRVHRKLDHQAEIPSGSLGGDRAGQTRAQDHRCGAAHGAGRRAPRPQYRQHCCCAAPVGARLLRVARWSRCMP